MPHYLFAFDQSQVPLGPLGGSSKLGLGTGWQKTCASVAEFAGSRFELRLRMFAGQMPPDEHAAVVVDDVTFE